MNSDALPAENDLLKQLRILLDSLKTLSADKETLGKFFSAVRELHDVSPYFFDFVYLLDAYVMERATPSENARKFGFTHAHYAFEAAQQAKEWKQNIVKSFWRVPKEERDYLILKELISRNVSGLSHKPEREKHVVNGLDIAFHEINIGYDAYGDCLQSRPSEWELKSFPECKL